MNLEPSENTSIYGYKYFFNEIIQLYNNRKMPNKILLSGKKGSGKSTFAYHLVNFFLSKDEELKYDLGVFQSGRVPILLIKLLNFLI